MRGFSRTRPLCGIVCLTLEVTLNPINNPIIPLILIYVYFSDNYIDSRSNTTYIVFMIDINLTSDLLRGHTDTIILKLLTGGDKYGYEITKLVHENSHQRYELKEATMYSSLKRLENDGRISAYWGDESQGGRRKYYRVTESGRELYETNKQNWDYAKQILGELL